MGLFFKKLSEAPTEVSSHPSTANFFIGSPEAEGETTHSSKIQLGEVFADFQNIFPQLESEKFIITGRKGSGKSAIAEYILYSSKNDPNSFCDFIKTRDFDLYKIVQLSKQQGLEVEEKLLFEWLILVKFIKQFTEDQSLQDISEYKDLKKFLNKNTGFVDIKSYEIADIVSKHSLEVNTEHFKRAFKALFKREIGITSHKAPFYKLLPHLKETVVRLLMNNSRSGNEYILIFDDLDIGFKEKNVHSIESIINILRVAKDYNIDYFGKEGLPAKIIVLLRDDIKRILVNCDADTAKVFSSYEIPIVWYEHDRFKTDENSVGLKKLINKRIAFNFRKQNYQFNESDPWSSLISSAGFTNGSSFKWVIDHTFFKPRDLILFFKPLAASAYRIPLTYDNLKNLLKAYSDECVSEIRNEMAAIFEKEDIDIIFASLKRVRRNGSPNYSRAELIKELERNRLGVDPETTIVHLFNYSLIGNIDMSDFSKKVYFKYREKGDEKYVLNEQFLLMNHNIVNFHLEKW